MYGTEQLGLLFQLCFSPKNVISFSKHENPICSTINGSFNGCYRYHICRHSWLVCSNLATARNLLPSVAKVEKSQRKESFFVPPSTSLRRPLFFLWYQISQRPTILWSSKDKKSAKPEPPSGNKKGGKVEIARNSLFFAGLYSVFYIRTSLFLWTEESFLCKISFCRKCICETSKNFRFFEWILLSASCA